jgi:hypothetical protein
VPRDVVVIGLYVWRTFNAVVILARRHASHELWGLDPWVCDALLNALVDAGFLRRTSDDAYVRRR